MKDLQLKALVQNYGFKETSFDKLPTRDFVYPDYTADGNTEAFRFSANLRRELHDRAHIVDEALRDKEIVWTADSNILGSVALITDERLGIGDLLEGRINSIYAYHPILFVGASGDQSAAYVVKPIVNYQMAWFEFTNREKESVVRMLTEKAREKPYRTFTQKLLGGLFNGK